MKNSKADKLKRKRDDYFHGLALSPFIGILMLSPLCVSKEAKKDVSLMVFPWNAA